VRDLRASENYSVYAIEHGLSADERAAARALLNAQLESSMEADRAYWLVWIAAAAEVGYRYDGSEYWDSFAAAFPRWPQYGDRNQIRSWYKRFASEFRGLTPSGRWARQFPIIAWPITQAILPRYLQRHFADHLYQLRHALARSGELTLDEIGDMLSERYFGGSSRFEGFLQQKALTARIVMALGREDVADAVPPIEAATLKRIARDFDKLGSSGSRLREARRVLRDARFVNSSKQGFVPSAASRGGADAARTDRAEQPRLSARPVAEQVWNVGLAIPDLATPLRQAGLSPHDLERARMRFRLHGEANTWIPGRALFSYTGQSTESLDAYPTEDRLIFNFERALPEVEVKLRQRLTLPALPMRLLKIRADGSAFEISGCHVRANQSYLLITAHPFADSIVQTLALSPLQTNMVGTYLWKLDVSQNLDSAQIAALKSLGLGYVLSVRIEALGLSPRWNSATGAMEFLDTEAALFSLSSDIAVQEFAIAVDNNPPVRFKPAANGKTYISLGTLAVGFHSITASALGTATGADIEAEEIAFEVRPSIPWQQAIAGKAGVSLALEPRQATLEQLLNGDAQLRISAPSARNVKLDARFYGANGTRFHEETLGRYLTPVARQKLSELVSHKLTSDSNVEHLERAARIELTILLDEYGSESVTFEKEAEPVRWLRLNATTVRLSDDSAGDTQPAIECYDLNAVDKARAVEYGKALEGIELRGKGGLLMAKQNGRHYGVIATTVQSQLTSFSELDIPATLSTAHVQPTGIINALKRWHAARRLMGPMAFMARRNAIHALEQRLELVLCGQDWIEAVGSVRADTLGELYGRVFYSRGFGAGLRAYNWRYEADESAAIKEFLRLTTQVYKVSTDEPLCRLALKLAFAPSTITKSDLHSVDSLDAFKTNTALIRGAYFARLAAKMGAQIHASEAA
jgi:hypothetical protein|tara:strand:+ start:3096 stop:5867 length:2772 start_codon:yes stop_codon:yes gene_type:complete